MSGRFAASVSIAHFGFRLQREKHRRRQAQSAKWLQMTLVSRPMALHNIDDAEAFAAKVIERRQLDWLLPHEREDLLCYLVECAWELSLRYQPQGFEFSQWVRPTFERRTIDWLRREFGRQRWQFAGHSYERERPSLLPFDTLENAELAGALTGGTNDPALDCSSDLAGVLGTGDRQEARDYRTLGLRPPRRAA
jgi:hypothetical protein